MSVVAVGQRQRNSKLKIFFFYENPDTHKIHDIVIRLRRHQVNTNYLAKNLLKCNDDQSATTSFLCIQTVILLQFNCTIDVNVLGYAATFTLFRTFLFTHTLVSMVNT